jgi:putative FmdB family regulatory protein
VPIYEYRCPNGHTFEVFQRMTDPPADSCAVCGAAPVEKVLFPVAVHFKGSGFYSTDYGRGSRGGKDADGGGSGPAKDSSSSDSSSGTSSGGVEKKSSSTESGGSSSKSGDA